MPVSWRDRHIGCRKDDDDHSLALCHGPAEIAGRAGELRKRSYIGDEQGDAGCQIAEHNAAARGVSATNQNNRVADTIRGFVVEQTHARRFATLYCNHAIERVREDTDQYEHDAASPEKPTRARRVAGRKKCAGGGLLREPDRVNSILAALRETVTIPFTVKTRIGFDDPTVFDEFLPIFARHQIDLLTVHGRTVKEGYRSGVHYDFIARAVDTLPCPVLANGNVYSAAKAAEVLADTRAAGLMIGRGAIRNPWLFHQIRQAQSGTTPFLPSGHDVLQYLRDLFETVRPPNLKERAHVQKMKKYFNYIAIGIEPSGDFLHRIRRVTTAGDLFAVCEEYLNHDHFMPLEPFDLDLKPRDVLAGEHR